MEEELFNRLYDEYNIHVNKINLYYQDQFYPYWIVLLEGLNQNIANKYTDIITKVIQGKDNATLINIADSKLENLKPIIYNELINRNFTRSHLIHILNLKDYRDIVLNQLYMNPNNSGIKNAVEIWVYEKMRTDKLIILVNLLDKYPLKWLLDLNEDHDYRNNFVLLLMDNNKISVNDLSINKIDVNTLVIIAIRKMTNPIIRMEKVGERQVAMLILKYNANINYIYSYIKKFAVYIQRRMKTFVDKIVLDQV